MSKISTAIGSIEGGATAGISPEGDGLPIGVAPLWSVDPQEIGIVDVSGPTEWTQPLPFRVPLEMLHSQGLTERQFLPLVQAASR
jgi:hypothetical protein